MSFPLEHPSAREAVKTNEELGFLHGVSVTVKECFEIKNVHTTAGSLSLADHISERDSAVVERLITVGWGVPVPRNKHTASTHGANAPLS